MNDIRLSIHNRCRAAWNLTFIGEHDTIDSWHQSIIDDESLSKNDRLTAASNLARLDPKYKERESRLIKSIMNDSKRHYLDNSQTLLFLYKMILICLLYDMFLQPVILVW